MTPMQASRQSEFMRSHLIGPSPGRRTDVYKLKCYCAILCVIVLCNTLLMNPLQRFLAQNISAAAGDWTPWEPRLQHLEIQLNETRSLLQQRLALPTTSNLYNISFDLFWLHIEKTGTSFFNTIFLNLCPRILAEHPEVLQSKLIDGRLLSRFPPSQWCEATVLNMPCPGCHFPYKERDTLYTTFTMFRDPLERLQSAYAFQRHGSKLNDTNISFETYINESHLPNCQMKMMSGYKCHQYAASDQINVEKALQTIQSPTFFFGITERWEETICLFHQWYGGTIQPFEMRNNRPTLRSALNRSIDYHDVDMEFVPEAEKIFDQRLLAAGCLGTRSASI